MKTFKVTVTFRANVHVTTEFVREYFEKMMIEKIHEPAMIEIEESKPEVDKL